MIPIFRKIRKQFADDNKPIKYLRYAIGEVILVVIGILIALQVNNWNENQTKKQILKTHLTNLIQDLKTDKQTIEILEYVHNFKYHSMLYMLRTGGSENYKPADDEMEEFPFLKNDLWQKDIPENYNKPFIQLAFLWSHRNSHYQVNENTQKELHSTGLYSYINQNLKTQLNNYYATWPFYFNEKVDNLAEDWMVTLGEDGFITADTYTLEDPLSLITNQPKRIGILKRLIRQTSWVLQGVQVMRKTNDELIKNIEIEISIL